MFVQKKIVPHDYRVKQAEAICELCATIKPLEVEEIYSGAATEKKKGLCDLTCNTLP